MRYSHQHKFILLANPKSGSTTLRSLLDPFSDISWDYFKQDDRELEHHSSATKVRAVFGSHGWPFDDYYSFTSIRNPWAKELSLFLYSRPDFNHRCFYDEQYEPWKGLCDFVPWMQVRLFSDHPLIPIDHYAFDSGKKIVDDILLMEDFGRSVPRLLDRLGLPASPIPVKNKFGFSVDYRDWYSADLRRKLAQRYAHDIEIGGYTFEGDWRRT